MLHKVQNEAIKLVSKEGQRGTLCSNEVFNRCPSFGASDNQSEEDLIDCLANILIDAYLEQKPYESTNEQNSK